MKRKNMGIGLLGIGLFFLLNPTVSIIDVIPDFIGYILMAAGLDMLADMEDHFASAKKSYVLLAVISGIKTLCCLILPFIDGTFIILLAFVFAVGECVLFIPAITNTIGGFHYYGLRYESESCYGIYKKAKVNGVEKNVRVRSTGAVLTYAYVVFIIRALGYVLPEIPTLFVNSQMGVINAYDIDWTVYIPAFYALAGIVTLAVGIPQAIQFRRYIKGVEGDTKLIGTLEKLYEENILPDKGHFAEKKTAAVWVLMLIASVFCFNIYIDYVNCLPGGVAGIFFAVAALLMKDYSKSALPAAISGFIWVIPSAAEVVLQGIYVGKKYTPSSFFYGIGESVKIYPYIIAAEILSSVFMIITVWLFAKTLKGMLSAHSVLYEEAMPETRSGKGGPLADKIYGAYKIAFWLMTAMAIASAAHGIICISYPEIWMLNIFIGVAMMIFLFRARNMANDDMYDKLRDRV